MQTCSNESIILQKTKELCEAIIAQPEFQTIRRQVSAFEGDRNAQEQYHRLSELGQSLHHKQHQGIALDAAEVAAFDKDRAAFFANPIAKGFVEAQETMHRVQETVAAYVVKTYELGRLPEASDFESGGCCGGHSHSHGEEGGCCGGHSHEEEESGCCGGKNHQGGGEHQHGGEGCGCRH